MPSPSFNRHKQGEDCCLVIRQQPCILALYGLGLDKLQHCFLTRHKLPLSPSFNGQVDFRSRSPWDAAPVRLLDKWKPVGSLEDLGLTTHSIHTGSARPKRCPLINRVFTRKEDKTYSDWALRISWVATMAEIAASVLKISISRLPPFYPVPELEATVATVWWLQIWAGRPAFCELAIPLLRTHQSRQLEDIRDKKRQNIESHTVDVE